MVLPKKQHIIAWSATKYYSHLPSLVFSTAYHLLKNAEPTSAPCSSSAAAHRRALKGQPQILCPFFPLTAI